MRKPAILVLPGLLLLALAACGGGGDDDTSGGGGGGGGGAPGYTPGVYASSAQYAARCQAPRTGTDPWTGQPWPDRAGSALHEKHFLRSWTNELYLWFDEVLDRNPADTGGSSSGVEEYFALLKTTALTASGSPKDQFHFTWGTSEYRDQAVSGVVLGYGISWSILRAQVPRDVVVEFVQQGTQAAAGGVRRGARLLSIDGVDVVNNGTQAGVDVINSALFSPAPGSVHTLNFRDRGGNSFSVVLNATSIAFDPVPEVDVFDVGGASVGYLLFNDHTGSAEGALRSAVQQLATAQVDELVLDLRYNGGGYLAVASEMAYMIAGPTRTANRDFERLQFNSKHPTVNPVTGQPLAPVPFYATSRGLDPALAADQPLPSLGLDRVYVLTSGLTCSASESIINGLRGIGVQVVQIGGDTCGKPYGFYAEDNCGTSYFSIQFRGVNDIGFGDYADGFSATRVVGDPQTNLPGCFAVDDLDRDLGDPAEGQLQAALSYLATGVCPAAPLSVRPQAALVPAENLTPALRKPAPAPWRNNRIVR